MKSYDAQYIRLPQLSSLTLGGGPLCSRHRSVAKGCALLLGFLCFSWLIYASRVYLFSQQRESNSVISGCEGCSTSVSISISSSSSPDGVAENTKTTTQRDELEMQTLGNRKSAGADASAEKTYAVLQRLVNGAESTRRTGTPHQKLLFNDRHDLDLDLDEGSDDSAEKSEEQKQEKSQVKQFFFFNPRPGARDWADFDDCDEDRICAMTSSVEDADVVLFNAARMKHVESLPKRRSNQIWVMYSREPPDLPSMDALDRPDLQNQVNYSRMVYSDSTWPVLYGVLEQMASPPEKDYENIFQGKRYDVAWFVSHCDRPSKRMEYVRRMMSTIDVHIYGECGNWTCGDRGYTMGGQKDECLEKLSQEYKFYLSFENTLCRDYVSEKFFNIFEGVDVIPVVRGGADYRKLFPSDILVDANDFPSPESLGTYLHFLGQDETAYIKMLRNKNGYKKGRYKTNFFCDLCERAHTGEPRHVYKDFYKWVRAPGNCWKPKDLDPL
ncbi:hypothetical protein RRG08_045945 [Elysia crispata]|uniref:Fucosyltransferase n=1 Tax=Elysia crispata TaxID=231223 RepID=A0AAE1ATD4_9GAST|nr:hypothetical protein RRG08_045945 [Elysia crispata]